MPSVERHQELKGLEEFVEQGEACPLLRIVPHEELANEKAPLAKKTQSHHEDKGSCPAGQAGRLGIKKKRPPEIEIFKPFIP